MYKDPEGNFDFADYEITLALRKQEDGIVPPQTFAEILGSEEYVKEHEIFDVLSALVKEQFNGLMDAGQENQSASRVMEAWSKQGMTALLNQLLEDVESGKIAKESALEQMHTYIHDIFLSTMENVEGKQVVAFNKTLLSKLDQAVKAVTADPDFQEVLSRYIYENIAI